MARKRLAKRDVREQAKVGMSWPHDRDLTWGTLFRIIKSGLWGQAPDIKVGFA